MGSKDFTEQILVGYMAELAMAAAGAQVQDLTNIQGSSNSRLALQTGDVDLTWEYTGTGAVIAFICWGLWALDSEGSLSGPFIAFLVVLGVAVGVFALARLLGRLILEQRLGRPRRTAKGAHAITGLFLAAAGIAYLREVGWAMRVFHWVKDLIW